MLADGATDELIRAFDFAPVKPVPVRPWGPAVRKLGIRYCPPYNCRHTYATICSMSGMNPAFIAQQLGHSVQMLLSTYARWINSSSDWSELEKTQYGYQIGIRAFQSKLSN